MAAVGIERGLAVASSGSSVARCLPVPKNVVIAVLAIALAISVGGGVLASGATRVDMRLWQSTSDPSEVWLSVRLPDEQWMTNRVPLEENTGTGWRFTDFFLDVPQQSASAPQSGRPPSNREMHDFRVAISDATIPAYRLLISNDALRELWRFDLDDLPSSRLAALAADDRDAAREAVTRLEALRTHVGAGNALARRLLEAAISEWSATERAREAQRLYMLSADDREALARWELTADIKTGAFAEYRLAYCDHARAIYIEETAEDLCRQAFASTNAERSGTGSGADNLLDAIQQRLGVR